MADLTISVNPLAFKAMAAPVVYEKIFILSNTLAKFGETPVSISINEPGSAELICPCPIPVVSIAATIYQNTLVTATEFPVALIDANVVSAECPEC